MASSVASTDTKVIKGYEQFLYRLMIIVGTIFTIAFVIKHPALFFSQSYSL